MKQDFIYSVNIIDLVIKKEFDNQIIFFVMTEGVPGKAQKFPAFFQIQAQRDTECEDGLFGRMVVFGRKDFGNQLPVYKTALVYHGCSNVPFSQIQL